MSKIVTLNLTIEKMRALSEIVQREIVETEHMLSPSPTLDELLKDRRNIPAGIESAIIHAEMEYDVNISIPSGKIVDENYKTK